MKKMILLIIVMVAVCSSALGIYRLLPSDKKLSLFLSIQKPLSRTRSDKPNSFVHKDLLLKKIAEGAPAWVYAQVKKDLSTFSKIRPSDLDNYFNENNIPENRLVRFQIKNGTVKSIIGHPELVFPEAHCVVSKAHSYQMIYRVLQYLAKNNMIPDVDFIVSLQDFMQVKSSNPVPIFTFAKDRRLPLEKDLILMPDWMNFRSVAEITPRIQQANKLFPWNQKHPLLFWRGSVADSTGFRHILVGMTKTYPQWIDAQFSQNNPALYASEAAHVAYRYQITIDGVRCTWERLVWQLHSNCLVFKHKSEHVQWFYSGLEANKHYIEVKDQKTLIEKLTWAQQHPEETQVIIHQAMDFAENNLELEDMYHYLIVLLQAYAKQCIS